jgi:hypothetical protein
MGLGKLIFFEAGVNVGPGDSGNPADLLYVAARDRDQSLEIALFRRVQQFFQLRKGFLRADTGPEILWFPPILTYRSPRQLGPDICG